MTGQRPESGAGFLDVGAQLAGLDDAQGKTLDELAKEIAGALGAAAVFTEDFEVVGSQFEHGKTVVADGHYRCGLFAAKKAVALRLGLLGRHAREIDLPAHAPADRGAGHRLPAPVPQRLQQPRTGFLAVLDELAANASQPATPPGQLDDFDRLGADVDADEAARSSTVEVKGRRIFSLRTPGASG